MVLLLTPTTNRVRASNFLMLVSQILAPQLNSLCNSVGLYSRSLRIDNQHSLVSQEEKKAK